MTIPRFITLLAGMAMLALSLQAATVVYDNSQANPSGSDPILDFGPLYDSFSTGSGSSLLNLAEFLLVSDNAKSTGSISVGLFSNSANTAGALIANLGVITDSAISTSGSLVSLSLTSTPILAANTRYWIGLSSGNSQSEWFWSGDTSGVGVASEFLENVDGALPNVGNDPYQVQIALLTGIPEPSGMGLGALSLIALLVLYRRRQGLASPLDSIR